MLINKTDMVIISKVATKKCKFCVNLQRSNVVLAVLKLLHLQKQPFKQYILYSLIIKLEDSKDSEDSNLYITTDTLALKEKKWIEAIFSPRQHLSLSHYVKFQSGHTHFPKLCLLKRIVLYKKQNFWVFESSNIRNKNKQVNKSHILSHLAQHTSP